MPVKFLSPEWAQEVEGALNGHPGFRSAIAGVDLGLQFHVNDSPEGDLDYYLKAVGNNARLSLGIVADPDVTVSQTYDTATAISKGELNTQMAFMTGRLKVSGNLAKLIMHQAAVQQWQAAVKDIEVEY